MAARRDRASGQPLATSPRPPLDVWGGLECSVVRIGDHVRDQVVETGHRGRPDDLDRIAALGIRTLRYPVLWETVSPDRPDRADFVWHDRSLARLQTLGIRPIVGLVHHGSGPRYTNLLDRGFPRGLALHAAAVARRYPWVDLYTPVNEPLTTTRFSGLYGHWYPHGHDYRAFVAALVSQCRATLLAMQAIRRVNPSAKLVQTEDFGRVFSTPGLAYQAEHENERRWLTFDLLFGRVDRHHPWWRILRDHGVSARDLDQFRDGEARPDIVGINHYLTSERFLDERLERYPAHLAGGNGRDVYADVEAIRVPLPEGALGPAARLREVWQRYGTPIAVTETHHGCTRDEQLRWLNEVWQAANKVRQEGADIRAVTVWSLFGAVDWNSLLTRRTGIYEPGAFDIRGPAPRPTALAGAVSDLAASGRIAHPVLDSPGWWRRDGRFYVNSAPAAALPSGTRPILVTGQEGAIRRAILLAAAARGLPCTTGDTMSTSGDAEALLTAAKVWAVLDIALPAAESPDRRRAAAAMADACRKFGLPYLLLTGTSVFGEAPDQDRTEADAPTAGDRAGRDALHREAAVLDQCPRALVIRTGGLFGPVESDPLVAPILRSAASGDEVTVQPGRHALAYLPDLAHVLFDLLIDGEKGVRHVTSGSATLRELADILSARVGGAPARIVDGPIKSSRPVGLATVHGNLMPPLVSAVDRYVTESSFEWRRNPRSYRIAAE